MSAFGVWAHRSHESHYHALKVLLSGTRPYMHEMCNNGRKTICTYLTKGENVLYMFVGMSPALSPRPPIPLPNVKVAYTENNHTRQIRKCKVFKIFKTVEILGSMYFRGEPHLSPNRPNKFLKNIAHMAANQSWKCSEYDVTSCFRSAAKYNIFTMWCSVNRCGQ